MPFKGDTVSEVLNWRFGKAISNAFNAAISRCVFHGGALMRNQNEGKFSMLTASVITYLFRCVCDASYGGRMARQECTRIKERHPGWLSWGQTGSLNSAILAHLVGTGHRVNPDTALKIACCVPVTKCNTVHLHTLSIAEAIGIRELTPTFLTRST